MKKQFFSALLCGAVVLSAGTFVSCENQYDELSSRVTVLEGYISEIKAQLGKALMTGASITSATQDAKGNWTFVLSNGETVVINASTGGGSTAAGGSSVTVTQGEGNFTITVDGESYTIPTGASVNSLVYVPEYVDGKVLLGNDGAKVRFLATPAVDVAKATFDIAVAEELKTRASSLIKVESAAAENGYVVLTLKGLAAQAGKSYVVVVSMTSGGTTITSDAFTVEVASEFSFESEALAAAEFADGVQATELGTGEYSVLIPNSAVTFVAGFNLKDYYKNLPSGNVAFQLAPADKQNAAVQGKYDLLSRSLASDGKFEFAERPGSDFYDQEKNGILIYMTVNDVIKNKVYWKIDNPVPGLDLAGAYFNNVFAKGAPHMEWGYFEGDNEGGKYLKPGDVISFAEIFIDWENQMGLRHGDGANQTCQSWGEGKMEAYVGDEQLFYTDVDAKKVVLGDYGKALTGNGKYGKGFWWQSTQPSVLSSNRRNWGLPEEEMKAIAQGECNGEIIQGWDGISGEDLAALGVQFDETGYLRLTDAYTGVGLRLGLGVRWQDAYGDYTLVDWHIAYVFFNRRVCAPGTVDVQKR